MKNIIIIMLLLLSGVVHAEEINPKFFKSWLTLSELLQSKGIIPSAPSWSVIIPMCLHLRKGEDETDYNRCLYEKTMDEFAWSPDYKYCETTAQTQYISGYTQDADTKNQQAHRTIIRTGINGTTQIIDYIPETITYTSMAKSKDAYFQDCMMKEKNWNSYERWTMGKHPPEKKKEPDKEKDSN